jgi:hypothetical protein
MRKHALLYFVYRRHSRCGLQSSRAGRRDSRRGREIVPDSGAAELRRLRHFMRGRHDPGLPGRVEHLERRGVVVLIPARLRVSEIALGDLAVGKPR